MKTKFFTLFLALLASIGIISAATDNGTCGTNLKWSLDKSTGILKITGSGTMTSWSSSSDVPWYSYRSSIKSITIGNSVTSIGDWAFYDCSGLTSITIPNSVTSIGSYAFYGCTGLTSVTIPNSVTSIGDWAFYDCSGLRGVTIPSSVSSIGNFAFRSCSGLTSPVYNAHVFAYMPTSCSGAYTIPNGIESIAGGAFLGCYGLTSVTIPNSVTSIGWDAFYACYGLTSVTIPNSVTSIGHGAFNLVSNINYSGTAIGSPWGARSVNGYVDGLFVYSDATKSTLLACFSAATGKIVIPNSVTSIENYAFYKCTALTSVTIGNSVTSIGSYAFYGCTGLTSVTIPNSVTGMGLDVFSGCSKLAKVEINSSTVVGYTFEKSVNLKNIFGAQVEEYIIGEGVTSIGSYAFYGCTGLTSVTIPNSVTSIGSYAFSSCTGLTSVTIGNSVTSIGEYAFSSCNSLTSITIPNSVTSIGNNAFKECRWLKSITIGNSVTSIGEYAFSSCNSLTSITIPNSVTSIGDSAFSVCSKLSKVEIHSSTILGQTFTETSNMKNIFGSQVREYIIGEGVTSIGSYAFYFCSSLTSVTIPNSVTSIGSGAFNNCKGLTKVEIRSSTILGQTFTETSNMKNIFGSQVREYIIGEGVTSIGSYAFYGCIGLGSVTIPNSVTSIGSGAFNNCKGLTKVEIRSSTILGQTFTETSNMKNIFGSQVEEYIIGEGVTSIGSYAFYSCSSLTSVTIPNSVTSIGSYAFTVCDGLTSVTIPNSVTSIGEYAFSWCNSLTSITIPNSVTSIGNNAFANCRKLKSITIGNSVTSIGSYAFTVCDGLTSVTIPNSVTSIGSYAFSECYRLTSVTIGNSVTSIGKGAFYNCDGLTSVTCKATVPPIICCNYWAFFIHNRLFVPAHSIKDYKAAFEWKEFLIIQAIGSSEAIMTSTEARDAAFSSIPKNNKVSIVGYVTNIAEEWSSQYANISFWMADTKGGGNVFEAYRVKCDRQEEAPVVGDKVKVCGYLTVYNDKIPEIAAGGTFEILERADGIPVQADEINNNEVKATPTDDGSVVITWPEVEGATSYTIDIRKKGELICTLVFNSNGQLISIKFAAPSCNGNRRDVAAATQAKNGWSYTITGMESGATYTYSVTAKDDSGTKLFEQSIEYTMPAVQGIVDIDASANQSGIHKFIKNGQLFIQRGNELFNAQGARVK